MPTIKGPITFKKGGEIPADIIPHIKLPFKADNFKSTHHQDLVEPTGIKKEPVKKPVSIKKKVKKSSKKTRR